MNTAVIIPVGGGREENLTQVLSSLVEMTITPKILVLVCDGEDAWLDEDFSVLLDLNFRVVCTKYGIIPAIFNSRKHKPGMEQPRNAGLRVAERVAVGANIKLTHAWFLDSDCIVSKGALAAFEAANVASGPELKDHRILVGPYDWLAPGYREEPPITGRDVEPHAAAQYFEMLDPRWISFKEHKPEETLREDLSAGLACFSGNLVWPISEFKRVGGFWEELFHGRCEDGELGIRAVHMGVPIAFVPTANAFHLWHTRNAEWIEHANSIDVPKLNERHPWMQDRCVCGRTKDEHVGVDLVRIDCSGFRKAIFVVDEDGKRFNARCECGWEGNTILLWEHRGECPLHRISEVDMRKVGDG